MKLLSTWIAICAMGSTLAAQSQIKFIASDGVAGDFLGSAVAVGANYTILGAYGVDHIGANGGAAYVLSNSTGAQVTRLVPATSAPKFGKSVGVEGNLAVVGAEGASHGGLLLGGAAYLYSLPSGQELFRFQRADAQAFDAFGTSIDLSGDNVIVGSPRDDDTGIESGSAYVFDVQSGQQLHKLLPNDGSAGSQFGFSVAISGDIAIVGSPFKSPKGGAHLFDITTGQQLHTLSATLNQAGRFGWSVAIDGDKALVGAPFEGDAGAVYVFSVSTGQLLSKLDAPQAPLFESFGSSVAMQGNRAVVGASSSDNVQGNEAGAAFTYDLTTFAMIAELAAGDQSPQDQFGYGVGVHGDLFVVGSPNDDDDGIDSGSASFFNVSEALNPGNGLCYANGGACPCPGGKGPGQGCGNTTGVTGAALIGSGHAALTSDSFHLQVTGLPGNKPGLVLRAAQSLNGGQGNPAGDGLLCASGQVSRSHVQTSSNGITTFSEFKGQPFGASTYGSGVPVHYQFWYRDTQNTCTGAGFNFSNAWTVTWLP